MAELLPACKGKKKKFKTVDDPEQQPDDDDDEQFDPIEDVNYRKFMGLAHVILTSSDELQPFEQFKDDALAEILRTAQKVAAAWSEVVKSIERRLESRQGKPHLMANGEGDDARR